MSKLEPGEEYLTIALFGGQVKLTAFPNKEKIHVHQPDFKGDGLAIWISKKKQPQEERSDSKFSKKF